MNFDEPDRNRIGQRKISSRWACIQCVAQNDFWKNFRLHSKCFTTYRLRRQKMWNPNRLLQLLWSNIHQPKWNLPDQKDYLCNSCQQPGWSIQVFQKRHYSLRPLNCHLHKLKIILNCHFLLLQYFFRLSMDRPTRISYHIQPDRHHDLRFYLIW